VDKASTTRTGGTRMTRYIITSLLALAAVTAVVIKDGHAGYPRDAAIAAQA
jgi:hypothetical protein